MKILHLGPLSHLVSFLKEYGEEVISTTEILFADSPEFQNKDFVVSYGYRHILRSDVLKFFPNKIINLHISMLPWNRGADPNLWSFLEDTPKGVTIHYMDEGIDTGDILAQKEVPYLDTDTLKSSYERLQKNLEEMFKKNWGDIRVGKIPSQPQATQGSLHRKKDALRFNSLLTKGWDTPVIDLIGKAKEN